VAGCFGCKVSSLQFATAPTNDTRAQRYDFDRKWAAEFHNGDREAYRRLRANGEQPPTIAGSAHLERHASTSFEISSGQVANDQRALKEALAFASDGGIDPLAAVTTPVEV
jgi:hypothetical protein